MKVLIYFANISIFDIHLHSFVKLHCCIFYPKKVDSLSWKKDRQHNNNLTFFLLKHPIDGYFLNLYPVRDIVSSKYSTSWSSICLFRILCDKRDKSLSICFRTWIPPNQNIWWVWVEQRGGKGNPHDDETQNSEGNYWEVKELHGMMNHRILRERTGDEGTL